jgi:tRNA uracil 4-sulfurtransferase
MYLISAGELFLKGKNVSMFENALISNLIRQLDLKKGDLIKKRFRYIINKEEDPGIGKVFGISQYAKVTECDFDQVNETALSLVGDHKSFRISAKRSSKEWKNSDKINREVGEYVFENAKIKVDLHNPSIEIFVDIMDGKAYVYGGKIEGLGGLPVGVTGDVELDIEDAKRRIVAGYLVMKRGCNLINAPEELVKFGSFSGKNRESQAVVKDLNLENIKKSEELVLYPLLGFTDKEISSLYSRIEKL